VKPGYQPDSLEQVARICRVVEGMPLSLLLASTWVSDYSAEEIAAQISCSLDFLTVELADLPARQRSLRATFEYSWNLLNPREQDALIRLAVFRNPFDPQAAHQVANASIQLLHTLVGKSLLGMTSDGHYQMHDLVRQYSTEKLNLASDAHGISAYQQHCDYFLERAAGWSRIFKGPQQSILLVQADKVIDDVQSAWEWAAHQADLEWLWRASEGLMLYYSLRYRYQEGEKACQAAIEGLKNARADGERLNLEGWLLTWQASFCRGLGKLAIARQLLDNSLENLRQAEADGQDTQRGMALFWRESDFFAVSLKEKKDCLKQSVAFYQALDDAWSQAEALSWAGEYANRLGDYELALSLHQQAETLSRSTGDPRQLANSLKFLGYDHLIHGTWETGARLMEEAATWYRSIGDKGSQASADLLIGATSGWIGRYREGCKKLERALVISQQLGDRYYIVYTGLGLGIGQMHSGCYALAVRSLQDGLIAARQDGFKREEAGCLAVLGCLAMVNGEDSQALTYLSESVANYRQMGFAGELGMALGGLALAHHRLGQEQQAWATMKEALRFAVDTHSRFTLFILPAAVVVLLADAGRWEQVVEAYSAVMTDPIVANSLWFADMVGNRMELAREHLLEDIRLAAEARGRQGDIFDVLAMLEQEIGSRGTSLRTSSLN
jgi:tetratricopeptide (TPR) repeat protein